VRRRSAVCDSMFSNGAAWRHTSGPKATHLQFSFRPASDSEGTNRESHMAPEAGATGDGGHSDT
jgi:hypothetical protein